MAIEDDIREALRKPGDDGAAGFDALAPDGSTKPGLSEPVIAAMARKALTRWIEGAVFNDITAHRDGDGQLMRIEIEYMDAIHDPAPRRVVVDF